jgi:phenylacetic acid degradation operon negative regulatory protein
VSISGFGGARRPKTLILDLYGRYAAQVHGWIAVSDLVALMGRLGVDEQAVRSAVSRMTRRGLLRQDIRDGVRGYATTSEADELFADGDRHIYTSVEPARLEDGWTVLSFSMPEAERDKRHVLRSKLMWLGMGNLSSGLWIGPRRILPDAVAVVKALRFEEFVDVFSASYEGMGNVAELVRRSWDLPELSALYSEFVAQHRPRLDQLRRSRRPIEPERAFVVYTLALHEWRKFPYLDPGLPVELLPQPWPGRVAATIFHELRSRLEETAFDFVATVVGPAHRHAPGGA